MDLNNSSISTQSENEKERHGPTFRGIPPVIDRSAVIDSSLECN